MRILIIKPSSFGDIVHGLLVADRIRAQIPAVTIDWVARDIFAGMVEASGLARRVHRFHRSTGGFFRVCREIRREVYDITLDMQGLARSGLMTFFSRAKMKIGRFDAREGSRLFYRVKVPPPPGLPPFHAVDILRQFQRSLGLYDLDPGELTFPDSLATNLGVPPGSILLFPESRRAEKEWGGFAELAKRLARRFPDRTIGWLGTGRGTLPVEGQLPDNLVDFRRKIPLVSLPASIREASVVIANDSGPMHLAAAMGCPVVAVFGPTDPRQYGPYPFDRPENISIRGGGGNLSDVSVPAVEKAVESLFC